MNITDLEGNSIEVVDLDQAIRQAEQYRHWQHEPPIPQTDSRRQAYWEDLYQKLTALKKANRENLKY